MKKTLYYIKTSVADCIASVDEEQNVHLLYENSDVYFPKHTDFEKCVDCQASCSDCEYDEDEAYHDAIINFLNNVEDDSSWDTIDYKTFNDEYLLYYGETKVIAEIEKEL